MLTPIEDSRFSSDDQQILRSDRRAFSRLSALASWRSEYILRTRLLRSLGRGKPGQYQSLARSGHSRHGATVSNTAVTTYFSSLGWPVSHIHATFGTGLNKKQPLFVHGASEQGLVTKSDPATGKVDDWGLYDHAAFKHFSDLYIGDAEYGLGSGDVVGMPNVLDLSQQYGKVYGEACPGGRVFFTSVGEQRGRFLKIESSPQHDLGIPEISMLGCAVTSVWIVKSEAILRLTGGIFGLLAGFSNGVLSAYALGSSPVYDQRFERGEPTAKWVLSPGVPIISIQVDLDYSMRRHENGRIWAVVLNALGEIFYLTSLPTRPDTKAKLSTDEIDRVAWATGRSCKWTMIDASQRMAKPDPFNLDSPDVNFTPRSSHNSQALSKAALIAEAQEIEAFLTHRPKHFRKICEGWEMRQNLRVDFAGDDRHGAGESIVVIKPGIDEQQTASVRRFTRQKTSRLPKSEIDPGVNIPPTAPSLFGGPSYIPTPSTITSTPKSTPESRSSSQENHTSNLTRSEWFISDLNFGGLRSSQVSTSALDESMYATLTASEDPLFSMNGGSSASSTMASPFSTRPLQSSSADVPGQRGRFLAVGLMTGIVVLWDIRATRPPVSDVISSVSPVRVIYTESPQISCLALTSLYVVHGGNDGLVQAWDPLASTTLPIRTLNSRFSSRARRRLVQAEMSIQGIGHNYYAAGAVVLDPDPTVLRGMVSLGTQLRYWSYSSSAADQYKSSKRRLRRRSGRGSNGHVGQHYTHSGRGALKDYIANEKLDMELEGSAKRKEIEHLSGRFGTDLLGPDASEEELIAYATMLSEESYSSDQNKRSNNFHNNSGLSSTSGDTLSVKDTSSQPSGKALSESSAPTESTEPKLDADLAEAIRLSLLDQQSTPTAISDMTTCSSFDVPSPADEVADVPIRYSKSLLSRNPPSPSSSSRPSNSNATLPILTSSPNRNLQGIGQAEDEDEDLNFAIRLSLAEEESRKAEARTLEPYELVTPPFSSCGIPKEPNGEEYPELERNITAGKDDENCADGSCYVGKGKGKAVWQ
ncbi:putative f-box and wd domain protein [Phaeomoniella chlamydospora]|uniref:Putative f-box and wd domain protein n=1 Tax=Phaeomoniella chlamydospora TaxID=158046 RepID=A0A0G2GL96_PHACM|nr:putative f-box and wd domain protein [Phaeomoniella chlamydospora]